MAHSFKMLVKKDGNLDHLNVNFNGSCGFTSKTELQLIDCGDFALGKMKKSLQIRPLLHQQKAGAIEEGNAIKK